VTGPLPVDPDLRNDLAARAATYPELRTNRLDTLLQSTPTLPDQALVDRIRKTAADTAERLYQDVPDVYDRVAALEAEVALSRRLDPRPTSQTAAQREITAFDPPPPLATSIRNPASPALADSPEEPAAADPIKAVVSQLDRLRPEIEEQDQNLATRIDQLAFDVEYQPPRNEQKFATLVAYALQDAERQGHRIPIDPDLHERLDTLASTYPGLEHPRLKELVASTPSIEDPDLVEEIRYTAQVAADSTNQNSTAIAYLLGKLETSLGKNADRARPNPVRPADGTTLEAPAAIATTGVKGSDRAVRAPTQIIDPIRPEPNVNSTPRPQPPESAAPARVASEKNRANDQARDPKQLASTQTNPETQNQRAARDSGTQVQIGGVGGLVAAALTSVQPTKVPEKAAPERTAPARSFLDNSNPLADLNAIVYGDRPEPNNTAPTAGPDYAALNAAYENNSGQQRRDTASVERARNAGSAARDALQALHKNPGETVLKRIQEAAAQTRGGMHEVLAEMRQGGKYQDLREAFNGALTRENTFSAAYKDATAKLGTYADQRTKIAPIIDKQPNSTAIAAQLRQLDAEVGEVAAVLPGEKEGQSALEDLKERAAEFVEKAFEAIKNLFKRNPDAAPASRPSPSPGP
jgi:hypothetical protein